MAAPIAIFLSCFRDYRWVGVFRIGDDHHVVPRWPGPRREPHGVEWHAQAIRRSHGPEGLADSACAALGGAPPASPIADPVALHESQLEWCPPHEEDVLGPARKAEVRRNIELTLWKWGSNVRWLR
ncbi:MAG: hypothetical protein IT294_14250 [Deltaproteobacteria bacterium]|nr:hypothetical protein [Deltaproteobacteria bacterium]